MMVQSWNYAYDMLMHERSKSELRDGGAPEEDEYSMELLVKDYETALKIYLSVGIQWTTAWLGVESDGTSWVCDKKWKVFW